MRARVEIDEDTLRKIAERTGGRYFHAANAEALQEVIEEIDRLERSEIAEIRYLEYEYHYASFVSAGLVLIAASALLSDITHLAGVVMLPRQEQVTLRQMEFLSLSDDQVLVILVVNEREVQNRIIRTGRAYGQSELQQAANYLNGLCE